MTVFEGAVKHWSRVRELEADAASRRFTGPQAPARARIRTALISSVANRVMAETAAMPQAAAPDLVEAMLQRAAQAGFPPPSAALSDRQPHPTDTHPSTIARIEALGLTADEYLLSRAGRPIQADELDRARGLFADWGTLCRDLSADAVEFATQQHSNHQAALRRAAAQRTEAETQVFQAVRGVALRLWLPGSFFGPIGRFLTYVAIAKRETVSTMLLSVAFCLLTGGFALWNAVVVLRSRHIPYLTLTADGFVCRGLDRMIPWVCVEHVNLVTGQTVSLTFKPSATTKLPLVSDQPILFKTVRVNAKQRTVVVHGKPRGMQPDALLSLIGRHLNAAQAHAALHGPPELSDQVHPAPTLKGERREPRLTLPLHAVRL